MSFKPVSRNAICGAGTLMLGLFPHVVSAAAWTRPQGDWLVLVPTSYTVADSAFDADGDRVDRRRFEMVEISPLIEYGFSDSLTGGFQPKFRDVKVDTANGTASNSGLAEVDLYLRKRLW